MSISGPGIQRPLAAVVALALATAACSAPPTPGASGPAGSRAEGSGPASAGEAVTLNVIDVAGNLQLTQSMIDAFVAANPDRVAKVNYDKAPSPELASRIQAQQGGNNLQTDLVLTGTDALSAGIELDLWEELAPMYEERAGTTLEEILLEPANNMQALAEGFGVVITYYPSGPLLEYDPEQVSEPPTTPEALLEWAKANPGKFMYARPANSGPGRTFLQGLPYLLGDKDPMDPEKGWDKTWAYLEELGQYIEYYPTGTGQTMTELGQGTRAMIASTTGWDINPRALGTVPKEAQVAFFDDFTWVSDAHYFVVPKGVDEAKRDVLLDLLAWIHQPQENAKAYDAGYFYPGPAVKGAELSMAPEDSQAIIKEFGRPEYDQVIADNPVVVPLGAAPLVKAFEIWDERIGGDQIKEF